MLKPDDVMGAAGALHYIRQNVDANPRRLGPLALTGVNAERAESFLEAVKQRYRLNPDWYLTEKLIKHHILIEQQRKERENGGKEPDYGYATHSNRTWP